jgi:putative membrane-bound dehydrogenase-like protein
MIRIRCIAVALVPCLVSAAAPFTATDRQPTPAELIEMPAVASAAKAAALLKDVRVPDDFDVSIFATPPAVNYPVFVAAAPDGTLYVSSDGNGSLDRKPHLGRVLRVRDTNGDGQADEVRALVPDVDSPRGLVWDHDRLYLLHPPDISVFFDRDGDGVAEERRTLVTGIAFGFKDRPADHSSNGLELGIDGWLYAAIGDFGFMEATGTDGRKLQLRGGGVVRVRPDGTGLELWADGTRNILEVAVSPLLDGFARDNTNDGGGWDVRFHHFSGMTQHGYPRLFKNFGDEIVTPLADYGGGSGCGGGWIDEPGIPSRWNNAPFTADWGRDWIYHHGLTPKGATFTTTQEEFIRLPRVTDLDVDANSAIYAASWKGASFTWVGPEVGFIVRATPKGYTPDPLPDFSWAPADELVGLLGSKSHRRRLEAQRSLIRRGLVAGSVAGITRLAAEGTAPIASRIAAVFTLKQGLGVDAHSEIARLLEDPAIAPWAIRALGDRPDQGSNVPVPRLVAALASPDPRTRKEALISLARLNQTDKASAMLPLTGDADPIVAHTAVEVLMRMQPVGAAFGVVDAPDAPAAVRRGALRVLQSIPKTEVVDGLIWRLGKEREFARRQGLLTALCRLYHVEGLWKGDSWGTRPDTRGPLYQPEEWAASPRILNALQNAIESADSNEAAYLGRELSRHRVQSGAALRKLIRLADTDPALLPAIAAQLATAEFVPADSIPALTRAATLEDMPEIARCQAVQALAKSDRPEALRALLVGLPRALATRTENHQAERARSAFLNSPHMETRHDVLISEAAKVSGEGSQWADVALLRLASRKTTGSEIRTAANQALDAGWSEPRRRAQILRAAAVAGDATRAAQFVEALQDPDATVVAAAKKTLQQLKIDPARIAAEAKAPRLGDLGNDDSIRWVLETRGDVARGEQLFTQTGCNGCHTVRADEPLKGPYLGTIANTYRRRELAEAILIPDKTLAQGFITHHFELMDGSEVDGFVVQEAADAVTIRTVTAQEQRIAVTDIVRRDKLQKSLMPEGLAAGWTVKDFASVLDYLEALAKAGK